MPVTQRKITFLDTPGHAAFLDMRKRGAVVTDIVVLVVAADDSVKPQTIEAIKHAKEANVHIIVAINKVDKEDANIEKVKQDLAQHEIYVEDYQGDTQAIPLSGKTGQGMDALEESIIALADISDFRSEIDGPAEGWIIESKITNAGRTATVLVRRGTLRIGDYIVAGNTWARVRTLKNDAGVLVSEAPPGTPVQVDGWRGEDPTAGLEVLQADDEDHAKEVVELRMDKAESMRIATDTVAINKSKAEEAEAYAKVREWRAEKGYLGKRTKRMPRLVEGWVENTAESGPKKVAFVVKGDVAGSVEAITAAVGAIGNDEVVADVVHSGQGQLSEFDIKILAATGEKGYAITFNQTVDATMYRLAEAAGLRILDHNIIYKVTDEVKELLSEELPPLIKHRVLGEAEIGQIFEINAKKKVLKVAGCRVTNGTISKSQKVRVQRGGQVIYTGKLQISISPPNANMAR
jgi:translation initiation factor IF-2